MFVADLILFLPCVLFVCLSVRQICFYQSGIGTSLNVASNLIEGGTGLGLVDKVQEGYSWIADNWTEGDEIFIFGFSRGAYTVSQSSVCPCSSVNLVKFAHYLPG